MTSICAATHPDVLGAIRTRGEECRDHVALSDGRTSLTYGSLCARAAAVASALRSQGIRPGDRIALVLGNSIDFVVAAMGAMGAGAIFVPLAQDDPPARRGALLADCRPSLVVTPEGQDDFVSPAARSVTVAQLTAATGAWPTMDDGPRAAYLIYTSGTTGVAKGVRIATPAFAAAVASTIAALGLDETTRTLCVSPFHFDGSFATLWPTLASGGTVVLRSREALLFPRTFIRTVERDGITYTGFSPTYLRLVLSDPLARRLGRSSLRIVALGGETCSPSDALGLWAVAPEVRIFNRYGPTECTIAVTHEELVPAEVAYGTITLGLPHPGVRFYLADEVGRVLDGPGRTGELYIGGDQLMDGYWREPGLTAEVLRRDIVGEVVYRTGDVACRREDGRYVYVDRADRVVKRNGVRVSLVEIGAAFAGAPDVDRAHAVAYLDSGRVGVVVFVATRSPGLDPAALRAVARSLLAPSMLPDRVEVVSALPLTPSGKLDERALLAGAGLVSHPPVGAAGS